MWRNANRLFRGLVISILIFSCSDLRKAQKSQDWRIKYEIALNFYEGKDYFRAIILFEEILPIVRGLPEGEQIQFFYAYSHYYQKLYLLSSHYFKSFYETYSRSQLAEEAQFMHSYSLYMDSPIYNLDQTSSREAIQAMQLFINKHPESEYLNDGTEVISKLQVKLEKKAYERAKQYNKIGVYKSALVAFDNFRLDFPSSFYNEELGFLRIRTQYNLAKLSISSLQEDRFKETIKYYHEFAEKFTDSSYSSDAKNIYDDSVSRLNKIVKNN